MATNSFSSLLQFCIIRICPVYYPDTYENKACSSKRMHYEKPSVLKVFFFSAYPAFRFLYLSYPFLFQFCLILPDENSNHCRIEIRTE